MAFYILKRLLLIIPTLFGIMLINFIIVLFAPGGPVERTISQINQHHFSGNASDRIVGGNASIVSNNTTSSTIDYRGRQGVDQELIDELNKFYGFDKPAYERFFEMIINYAQFNFGTSYYRDIKVIDLIIEKMPVSISLGLWTTLKIYFISIPLGIKKAVKNGSKFDNYTSLIIIIGYAIPGFIFAILLIMLFASGNFLNIFPIF